MKPKNHTILPLAAIAGLALTASAGAATVLIDFGLRNGETTAATDTYNNPHLTAAGRATNGNWDSGVLGLVDTSNAATPWSIQIAMVNGGEAKATANVAAAPATITAFEQTAWEDHMFIETSSTVSLTGLNDALTYDLLFYGSRGSLSQSQTWSITKGSGGGDVTHVSEDNTTTVVDWDSISTDGNGEIEFTITSTGKQSALNFGSITSVPEPSATSLLGSVLGILLCRRKRVHTTTEA